MKEQILNRYRGMRHALAWTIALIVISGAVTAALAACQQLCQLCDICHRAGDCAYNNYVSGCTGTIGFYNATSFKDVCNDYAKPLPHGDIAWGTTLCSASPPASPNNTGTVTEDRYGYTLLFGCIHTVSDPNKPYSWSCDVGTAGGDPCIMQIF